MFRLLPSMLASVFACVLHNAIKSNRRTLLCEHFLYKEGRLSAQHMHPCSFGIGLWSGGNHPLVPCVLQLSDTQVAEQELTIGARWTAL